MTTEAEVYREAASLIRKYGWVQGEYGGTEEGFCINGALYEAARLLGNPPLIYRRVRLRLLPLLPGAFRISNWQDDPHRTVEDVLTLLEQAATEAEKEAQS